MADMKQLDELLALIDERIDLEHCEKVDERYRKSLSCEDVDRSMLHAKSQKNK